MDGRRNGGRNVCTALTMNLYLWALWYLQSLLWALQSSVLGQKWCGFGKVLLCIALTWLDLTVHTSKLLLLYLTEKWLWNIPCHPSWVYMKKKIMSSILVYSFINNSSSCTQLFIIIIIINYVCIAGKDRKAILPHERCLILRIWLDHDVWYEKRKTGSDKQIWWHKGFNNVDGEKYHLFEMIALGAQATASSLGRSWARLLLSASCGCSGQQIPSEHLDVWAPSRH